MVAEKLKLVENSLPFDLIVKEELLDGVVKVYTESNKANKKSKTMHLSFDIIRKFRPDSFTINCK